MPLEDDGEGDDSLSDGKVARHPHTNGEKWLEWLEREGTN